jgi:hypothetical protein
MKLIIIRRGSATDIYLEINHGRMINNYYTEFMMIFHHMWRNINSAVGTISLNILTYKSSLINVVTQNYGCGRAVAQAVSRRLPTAAARVRAQVSSCGICGGRSGTGEGFLRVLRFPLPILIPPTAPHSSSTIIRCWYNRPINGRRTKWTQSHPRITVHFRLILA